MRKRYQHAAKIGDLVQSKTDPTIRGEVTQYWGKGVFFRTTDGITYEASDKEIDIIRAISPPAVSEYHEGAGF